MIIKHKLSVFRSQLNSRSSLNNGLTTKEDRFQFIQNSANTAEIILNQINIDTTPERLSDFNGHLISIRCCTDPETLVLHLEFMSKYHNSKYLTQIVNWIKTGSK